MAVDPLYPDLETLVSRLAAAPDAAARRALLARACRPPLEAAAPMRIADRLKAEADHALFLQDHRLALRWSSDIVELGRMAGLPTVVALGRMVEALAITFSDAPGRNGAALDRFDEAAALFRAHGDDLGWARTQIGRTWALMGLGRFDEALERARQARAILERAGDGQRLAGLDNNLALLLERMNRPAEALVYTDRALAWFRRSGPEHHLVDTLSNRALLLWRLGRPREALQAHTEARQRYATLGAALDVAREEMHIGMTYLALGRYAQAVSQLTAARRELLAHGSSYLAAFAGLHLVECLVRLGRNREAVAIASTLYEGPAQCEFPADRLQALIWQSLAYGGLQEHAAALDALVAAAGLIAADANLKPWEAPLAVSRAQLLLKAGATAQARQLLQEAIPVLRESGLGVEAAGAQVVWGEALLEEGRPTEAIAAAVEVEGTAAQEGLDWLAARARHLHGRAALRQGDGDVAARELDAAVAHLERTQRLVAWDDRAGYAGGVAHLYADAMLLALEQGRHATALRYADRRKARALADHLHGHIDVRPRARDERSRRLIEEFDRLRERYAWLTAAQNRERAPDEARPAVRWAASGAAGKPAEAQRIEQDLAALWRELQAGNPAYRADAAALDLADDEDEGGDQDVPAERWLQRVGQALRRHGPEGTVLLEYIAVDDDLILFVVRGGDLSTLRLPGANATVQRLVSLLRLNLERTAAAIAAGGGVPAALQANARGLLGRLYDALLAPAAQLIAGAAQLVVVAHGSGHHVPFHALHDGRQYLIERCAVSYAPSAGLIEHVARRGHLLRAGRTGAAPRALVLACSAGGALPHVGPEGDAVTAALGGRHLREDAATLANLRAASADCAVLHVAAHGVFRPDEPLFSSLQLADGPLCTLDVFDLDLRCSLATLSACQTALGHAGAGDELMGLSRAFLYAGAPSLVLSLWKVADQATTALMSAFYGALAQGNGKAAALRHAQLALLQREYGAPFYWAPFQLIGEIGPL